MPNALDSLEARPVNIRSLDSKSISTVLDLNIAVGWRTILSPRYVRLYRRGIKGGEVLGEFLQYINAVLGQLDGGLKILAPRRLRSHRHLGGSWKS